MKPIYRAIESVIDFLRRTITRDSRLWNILRSFHDAIEFLWYNPINKIIWRTNHTKFESLIEKYSEEREDFFVLQIGACDGVTYDPIHKWIKKYGWRGILVEPQKEMFEKLKRNYDHNHKLIFENVAVAEDNRDRTLYTIKDENMNADWHYAIGSLLTNFYGGEGKDMMKAETVHCITFDGLLDRHQVSHIDLLQMDVDGYDYELIKLFDFERIKPQLFRYEHMHLRPSERLACKKYLSQYGYKTMEMAGDTGAVLQHR
jgi:FkbM family methyltransferase